jgi:hypothetical protein
MRGPRGDLLRHQQRCADRMLWKLCMNSLSVRMDERPLCANSGRPDKDAIAASPSLREISPAALTLHKVSTVLRLVMKHGAVDPQNLAPLM